MCRRRGRDGCCDGHGAKHGSHVRDCVSARTVAWHRGIAAFPGPAGSVWCKSSWGSSWAWPWAAEV